MLPRRIPDYPDAYSGWNAVSSFGSLVSVSGTFLFIVIIFKIFVENITALRNPWAILSFFFSCCHAITGLHIEAPTSNTIEWTLGSPIPLHAFNSLPKQS